MQSYSSGGGLEALFILDLFEEIVVLNAQSSIGL